MLGRLVACAIVSTAFTTAAFAQSPNANHSNTTTSTQSQNSQSLPKELKQKLKNDGFTNVQVVPSSFMVSAKDKNGDPVMMMIGPHSMTMLTEVPKSDNSTTGSASDSNSQGNSSQNTSK